jgi:hypothetical protein
VGGLVAEVLVLLWFSAEKSSVETGLLIVSNFIIAAGVFGEDHFAHKSGEAATRLQQISDEKVSEANARASEADQKAQEASLELARLTTPRVLEPEHRARMTKALKPFAGTPFDFSIQPDPEPVALMDQIADVLVAAGWIWKDAAATGTTLARRTKPKALMTTATGLTIAIDDTRCSDWEKAVLALQAQLVASDIDATAMSLTTQGVVTATAVHIKIGKKQ